MKPKAAGLTPETPVRDAKPGNWVDRLAPAAWRPYLRLARLDRPVGTWLLLFPCWWSLALAELTMGKAYPTLSSLALFAVGAAVMRGAGCTYNDWVDSDYDARVARTAARPIPSGQVTPEAALLFAAALSLAGLIVLLQFNWYTVLLGASSLLVVAIYPFMKRVTYWPQLVLGLAFNWGALVGWSSAKGSLALPAVLLFAGAVLWTIGYDTIYAHQDSSDDATLGLKSTALRFGDRTIPWVAGLYAGAMALWTLAAFLAGAHLITFFGLALVSLQLAWQASTLDIKVPENCLRRFRSNRDVGLGVLLALAADMALTYWTSP